MKIYIYITFTCIVDLSESMYFKETKSATMNIFRKKNIFFLNHL